MVLKRSSSGEKQNLPKSFRDYHDMVLPRTNVYCVSSMDAKFQILLKIFPDLKGRSTIGNHS